MLGVQAHAWTPKSEKARYGNVGLPIRLTALGPVCSQPTPSVASDAMRQPSSGWLRPMGLGSEHPRRGGEEQSRHMLRGQLDF